MSNSFTLIEILVVIVVIGILSSFILVGMSSITNSANIAKGQAFANSIDNSLLLSRVSEWKLDNDYNDSWNGKNLTPVNSPTPTSNCVQGSCYTFNGTTQYAWVADDDTYFNFGAQMSTFVWVKKINDVNNYRRILAQWDTLFLNEASFRMGTTGPGKKFYVSIYDEDGDNIGSETLLSVFDDKWHCVGFTYNLGVLKVYVDGTLNNTAEDGSVGNIRNSSTDITIGSGLTNDTGSYFWDGLIDNVRIYNQAIPTSEIQQNYYLGINRLFKNTGISSVEFNQRLTELKSNLSNN